jgi:hypothetical protein
MDCKQHFFVCRLQSAEQKQLLHNLACHKAKPSGEHNCSTSVPSLIYAHPAAMLSVQLVSSCHPRLAALLRHEQGTELLSWQLLCVIQLVHHAVDAAAPGCLRHCAA